MYMYFRFVSTTFSINTIIKIIKQIIMVTITSKAINIGFPEVFSSM